MALYFIKLFIKITAADWPATIRQLPSKARLLATLISFRKALYENVRWKPINFNIRLNFKRKLEKNPFADAFAGSR